MSGRDTVRRSQLITPGHQRRMIEKAAVLDCDSLILDLEDAVAPSMKAEARATVRQALRELRFPDKEIGVRVNPVTTPWFLDDVLALEGLPLETVVLPKVNRPEDVALLDRLLGQLELRGGRPGITLQPQIETAIGLEAVSRIATASSRLVTLIFGAADFSADAGVAFTPKGLFYARTRLVVAAAAAGLQAIDQIHPAIDDDAGLAEEAREAHELGYQGKWAIHPRQVPIINAAFVPSTDEVRQARTIIDAYESAKASGRGAISVDGMMVDEATLKMAARCAAIARRLGLWDSR